VRRDLILWEAAQADAWRYSLACAPQGGLRLGKARLLAGSELPLERLPGPSPDEIAARFPHLSGLGGLRLRSHDIARAPELLRGQVGVIARDERRRVVAATSLQIPGVLDDLFAFAGWLGVSFLDGRPSLRLWAPTARSVDLLLYADSHPATPPQAIPLLPGPAAGVWQIDGQADWIGQFYLYEVEVYAPSMGVVIRNRVTDPYSVSLAINSARSQIIDLDDPALMPPGWQTLRKPPPVAPQDGAIYELHVRDFSAFDETTPAEERGTFRAFTRLKSPGMRHLRALAQAGMTYIHLLPVFDFATVDDDRSRWQQPDLTKLRRCGPASKTQQCLVNRTRQMDGYNWGYDPYHYNVPEGSYATQPDGAQRILEFRQMVLALSQIGLRVVMDVVYNHTHAAGQDPRSVLDRVVPGYYHRLNADGGLETSTCCPNTASEHIMMEKLMIDSLRLWATQYKVDGFRFDIMGHHMLSNLQQARLALAALTPEKDGVDGSQIYLYGEGWNFGEVAHNARGCNASQGNLSGSGIGTFNDRLRDAARGGLPFSGLLEQGFLTGLYDEPNASEYGSPEEQRWRLLHQSDLIRLSLAGNLSDYTFVDCTGRMVRGGEVDYNGQPAGYTHHPQENILYISAHDNETLFDVIQIKAPASADRAERLRMHHLGLSLLLLGQGVPFIHAGDDLLRSKSLDRNSFDSGDWFNRLDFTGQTHNFGRGLPPAPENEPHWPVMTPLLADRTLRPTRAEILHCATYTRDLLRLRRAAPLFRLPTALDVQRCLAFYNTGPEQIPGLIVMHLNDPQGALAPADSHLVALFNACREAVTFVDAQFSGMAFALHPIQQASQDERLRQARFDVPQGAFYIPGRTAAVFTTL
jgi:pullulanase-type alpha-1,6-glucosidase